MKAFKQIVLFQVFILQSRQNRVNTTDSCDKQIRKYTLMGGSDTVIIIC